MYYLFSIPFLLSGVVRSAICFWYEFEPIDSEDQAVEHRPNNNLLHKLSALTYSPFLFPSMAAQCIRLSLIQFYQTVEQGAHPSPWSAKRVPFFRKIFTHQ